eukprot:TRINITY_DN4325_c0_g1_i1.p1 TRINITY_DN4325_c0_g1~~TRINITY_DN4325_c0_g1_i1.p1  ORF type:complete len:402 (+),score=105.22 TRINITY_DN4325_c0_g1_i1:106-1311(+)
MSINSNTELKEVEEYENSIIRDINIENNIENTIRVENEYSLRNNIIGIFCLLGVVVIWVGSGTLSQFLFTEIEFNKPFFLTYFSTTAFCLYLLGFLFFEDWEFTMNIGSFTISRSTKAPIPIFSYCNKFKYKLCTHSEVSLTNEKLSTLEVAKIALMFCPIWFCANYFFNLALSYTSLSSATILSATSSFFTLILGAFVGVEKITIFKSIAVVCCISGVTLVTLSDESTDGGQSNIIGDIISIGSAIAYACYAILLAKKLPLSKNVDPMMLFAFVGLFNFTLLWPIGFFLNWIGFEPFELPPNNAWGYLVLNAVVGTVISDYLWALGVQLTTPVVATIALPLSIPLAMTVDILMSKTDFTLMYFGGTILVFIGFTCANLKASIWPKFSVLCEPISCNTFCK